MKKLLSTALFLFFSTIACTSLAEANKPVTVEDAWVRATAPGQKVGAAYMTLTHNENISLVAAEANVAGNVEIHSMEMKNNIMKMRMLDELTIEAGKPTKLAPSGMHLMLLDLKKPLKVGEKVELTLCFKDKNGDITHQTFSAPIKESAR